MTQRRTNIHLLIFITIFLISGTFLFNTPKPVFAESITETFTAQSIPMTAQMSCNQGGCTQTHTVCDKHCVQQPAHEFTIHAMIPHTEKHAANSSLFFDFQQPIPNPIFYPAIMRIPPAHLFLRTVIKRE